MLPTAPTVAAEEEAEMLELVQLVLLLQALLAALLLALVAFLVCRALAEVKQRREVDQLLVQMRARLEAELPRVRPPAPWLRVVPPPEPQPPAA